MRVVLTTYLTAQPHPHTGERLPVDFGQLRTLRESVEAHGERLTVLHDCFPVLDGMVGGARLVAVPKGGNPFWYRWRMLHAYLTSRPEVTFAWLVDGTDTEMLTDPFPFMAPDVLYVGSEPETYSDDTMGGPYLRHCCPTYREFYDAHPDWPILNPGTTGGSRSVLLDVTAKMAAAEACGDASDMGAFQVIARDGAFVTGPPVHTPFRSEVRSGPYWWRHK